MEKLIDQLNNAKKQITLSADRKAAVRTRLLEVMNAPVRAELAMRHTTRDQSASLTNFFTTRMRVIPAIVALVLLGGSGVALAARDSRPGDMLYPVKIGVNENVRAAFAFTPQAKAQVAADRAKTRLEEAASLSSEGRLDAATEARLRANFEKQANVAEANINKMHDGGDVRGAADETAKFEGTLRAEQAILASFNHGNVSANGNGSATSSVTSSVNVNDNHGGGKTDENANANADIGESVRGRLNALGVLRARLESDIEDNASTTASSTININDNSEDNHDGVNSTTSMEGGGSVRIGGEERNGSSNDHGSSKGRGFLNLGL